MFTEQEYVQKIEATFDDLAAHGQRLRAPRYSAPGRQVAQDGTDWTPLSIGHLDRVRLARSEQVTAHDGLGRGRKGAFLLDGSATSGTATASTGKRV